MAWIVASLLPHREQLAMRLLALSGFPVYLPKCRERRVIRGRRVDVAVPLFPSYAFVEIAEQWHAARWTPGIRSLVMDGEKPARVPDKVITAIRRRERKGLIDLPPPLQPGDRVTVTRGLLAGLNGLYAGQSGNERVLLLLSMLGASRPVTLPGASVEAVR